MIKQLSLKKCARIPLCKNPPPFASSNIRFLLESSTEYIFSQFPSVKCVLRPLIPLLFLFVLLFIKNAPNSRMNNRIFWILFVDDYSLELKLHFFLWKYFFRFGETLWSSKSMKSHIFQGRGIFWRFYLSPPTHIYPIVSSMNFISTIKYFHMQNNEIYNIVSIV